MIDVLGPKHEAPCSEEGSANGKKEDGYAKDVLATSICDRANTAISGFYPKSTGCL
jgi:hypothetical protein